MSKPKHRMSSPPRFAAAAALCATLALPRPAAALDAAAAKIDITPDLKSEKTLLAGFDATGRKAEGVHDPLYARLVLMREGGTTVALVGLDLLGFYHNDVVDLRRLAGFDVPGRALFVGSTHTHSGPDTLGLWGPLPGVSGVNKKYQRRIKQKIAESLKLLESRLRPVRAEAGRRELDPRGLCRDTRDPQVIDPDLAVLRLIGGDGKAVATVVNWSCHPEVLQRASHLVTADFPGPLCARVEEKTGGACLYFQGMIGGLMTPDAAAQNFYEAYRIGTTVADAALALKPAAGPRRALAVRSARVLVPVENARFRLFLPALVFGHKLLDAQGRPLAFYKKWTLALRHLFLGLNEGNEPWVETEIMVVDVGPARLLGMPGEVFPELAIGGYDGRYSYGRPVTTPGNPNPPDLSAAPKGPYLRDLVKAPVPMLVGLANDELGYVIPAYDFKATASKIGEPQPPGHHYEETNSVGPSATRLLSEAAAQLLKEEK
jgi:hypothetical protein